MRLNITKIRPQDYGEYHCISKNEMGITRAVFHVQGNFEEWQKDRFTRWLSFWIFADRAPYFVKPLPEHTEIAVFGTKPPDTEAYEDVCGPPTSCPDCPDPRWVFKGLEILI